MYSPMLRNSSVQWLKYRKNSLCGFIDKTFGLFQVNQIPQGLQLKK